MATTRRPLARKATKPSAAAARSSDPFPTSLAPQLATLAAKPPTSGMWTYEIKFKPTWTKVKAEARAELEEQIRTGSPEEAQTARRVLREMQQATAPGGVVQATHVTERWTLIGQGC